MSPQTQPRTAGDVKPGGNDWPKTGSGGTDSSGSPTTAGDVKPGGNDWPQSP